MKKYYPAFFIGIILLVVVALFGIGRFGGNSSPSSSSQRIHSQANLGGVAEDQNQNFAPDFTLSKLGGGIITLSEYRGKKPVVVDFWASWCPNCRRDMSNLNRFYEKYKDQVEVIGVNLQESQGVVEKFIASRNISFPIALDPSGQVSRAFGIQYTNTHFLIDKEGNLVRAIPGDIREEDIQSLIQ